jgi:hypothetical protein
MLNSTQQYILDQIIQGRKLIQVNGKNRSSIQFEDNGEAVNIRTIQALRSRKYIINIKIKQ